MPAWANIFTDDLSPTGTESWRTFRVMAEMVTALDELNAIDKKCISIFGSARSKPGSEEWAAAETLASLLGKAGYGVITGGGPGVMEAANKGAAETGAPSIGLHIRLPYEQGCNPYVNIRCNFRYFFIRKFMFVKYARAFVVMPGGMGTIDELSEAFVLAQTGKSERLPIILYNSRFWQGFTDWIKNVMISGGYVRQEEYDRLIVVKDTPEEVMDFLNTPAAN